jgi:hypothetical protein
MQQSKRSPISFQNSETSIHNIGLKCTIFLDTIENTLRNYIILLNTTLFDIKQDIIVQS